jgi:hypothetical protein
VFEDPDEETLYLGRALPRKWLGSGKPISIDQAPTRWGRVDFRLSPRGSRQIVGKVSLANRSELPKTLEVTFRLPSARKLVSLTANGRAIAIGGRWKDTAVVETRGETKFEIVATAD